MKREVKAGVNFFKRLAVTGGKLDEAKAQLFAEKLQRLLCDKYDGHWYPDRPAKGQAFRCIRINKGIPTDEVLLKACKESELTPSDLCLPPEVTVWIDPLEVCVRSRESSYPFSIASFTDKDEEEEESVNKAQEALPIDPTNHDTSDYHSATSSDCGSAVSSDTEEEVAVAAKDQETEGEQEKKPPAEKQPAQADVFKIMKVPKIRRRHEGGSNRVSYYRNMVPVRRHFFCQPVPVWSHCMNHAPMLVVAPPPPPPCPVLVHYLPHPPPPHFVVPRAALKPWEPANDEMLGLRSSAMPI
ncbi:protein BTG3 [Syngnathus acus]|uniref:protein BTG3 n=1 Tax=Syngnathus acus TaxID=161584 RepID=UPI001885B5AF|nr:protein BTG3 [Syngnathus acus]XP_037130459.1 protein BTG3 [Syngnathus acus]